MSDGTESLRDREPAAGRIVIDGARLGPHWDVPWKAGSDVADDGSLTWN